MEAIKTVLIIIGAIFGGLVGLCAVVAIVSSSQHMSANQILIFFPILLVVAAFFNK